MSHFAQIKDGIVTNVIVAELDYISTLSGTWVQTSYNTYGGVHTLGDTPLRKNYAGIGHIYDSVKDVFHEVKPYASWTLDDDSCLWISPVVHPDDDKNWTWDESVYQANNSLGWVEI